MSAELLGTYARRRPTQHKRMTLELLASLPRGEENTSSLLASISDCGYNALVAVAVTDSREIAQVSRRRKIALVLQRLKKKISFALR